MALTQALLCPGIGLAQGANVPQLTHGEHSYVTLGPDFYTNTPPMAPAPGARLVLLDWDTVRLLGLSSGDLKLVEKTINEKFGLTVANGTTGKSYIATNYNDHKHRGPDRGDGRAFLAGEISVTLDDGRIIRLDIVVKGPGRTKPHSPDPRDGWLSLREAVHDFLTSKRNVRQQLDSTIDLGVIALGGLKYLEDKKEDPVPTGLLIRIGQQTRPAHIGGQGDSPENVRKMLDYLVRRNLGLPMDHAVGPDEIKKYMKGFVTNLAEEGARADDLGFLHGMMHPSNLTASGGSIDYGTSRQMDGYHAPIRRYRRYVDIMMEYLGFMPPQSFSTRDALKLGPTSPVTPAIHEAAVSDPVMSHLMRGELSPEKMNALYTHTYDDVLSKLWLTRLGLSPEQIERIPDPLREDFYRASYTLVDKRKLRTAELDMQGAFSRSLAIISGLPENANLSDYRGLFEADRKWSKASAAYAKESDAYIQSVRQLIAEIGDPTEVKRAIARAQAILPRIRPDYSVGSLKDPFRSEKEKDLYRQVQDPKFSFVENSRLADQIVEDTIHHGLLPRQNESLTNIGSLLYGERGKKVFVSMQKKPIEFAGEGSDLLDPSSDAIRPSQDVVTFPQSAVDAAACFGRRMKSWLNSF